jgi:ABC-type branched-subunit amino acid transport system substrate-binding protein
MTNRKSQIANLPSVVLLFAICYLLSACSLPGDAALVVKIGVIAPFEGAGRPLGYAVLPAIKAAAAEANARGDLGRYRVLVVAFNDDLHGPTAAAQARALALDGEVAAVVGPWSAETVAAAAPILAEAGLPFIARADLAVPATGGRWGDAALAEAAMRAGADTRRLLRAAAIATQAAGRPTRAGLVAALP